MPAEPPSHPPRVSFGLAVFNARRFIERCIDSVLAQTFRDFELVIADNASTDGTREIVQAYAAREPRIRLTLNPENIGQIENVNLVFRLSRGELFRWVGADDWLEPAYAERCVAALDADPGAIGVSTFFRTHLDSGEAFYDEWNGERMECPDPSRRFARMLWFFHASDLYYDPIYALYRREFLARTPLIRVMTCADMMLSAELALMGRFAHVPEMLCHRRRAYHELENRKELMRRYHPQRYREVEAKPARLFRVLLEIIGAADLTPVQRARCVQAAVVFCARQARRHYKRSFTTFRRERLGLTRDRIPFRKRPG